MKRMIRRDEAEKMEIIHLVEHSNLSVKRTLEELDVPRSTFYRCTNGIRRREKLV